VNFFLLAWSLELNNGFVFEVQAKQTAVKCGYWLSNWAAQARAGAEFFLLLVPCS
jgi:hypothetical protein